jgi:hypothetical protein
MLRHVKPRHSPVFPSLPQEPSIRILEMWERALALVGKDLVRKDKVLDGGLNAQHGSLNNSPGTRLLRLLTFNVLFMVDITQLEHCSIELIIFPERNTDFGDLERTACRGRYSLVLRKGARCTPREVSISDDPTVYRPGHTLVLV